MSCIICRAESHSPDSDQLELWSPAVLDGPWGGQSPRVLTAAYKRFSLEAGAGGCMSKLILTAPSSVHQFKGAHLYDGAPLLFPLKEVE